MVISYLCRKIHSIPLLVTLRPIMSIFCPSLHIAENQEQGKDKRHIFCPGLLETNSFSSFFYFLIFFLNFPFSIFLDFSFFYFFGFFFFYFFWIFLFYFFLDFSFFFTWTYSLLPVKLILIFHLDLLSIASRTYFHLFHLDLLSIASQSHCHIFNLDLLSIASQSHLHLSIWTYSLSPVFFFFLNFLFSSGLTSDCQFF